MPNDFVTLNALCRELNAALSGAKIDKIHMPEDDEITLFVRAGGKNLSLALSCNAQNPRIHFTERKKQNPVNAPAFCMLLRKFLTGATVEGCRMLGEDRIFCFDILSRNEMRDVLRLSLIAEMMGRYSNLLLVDAQTGTVKDALKQASFDTATKRCLLPGAKYELPPQNKTKLSDKAGLSEALDSFCGGNLKNHLLSAIGGFAPATAEEALYASGCGILRDEPLSESEKAALKAEFDELENVYDSPLFSPCASVKNGRPDDYFAFPYASVGTDFIRYPSMSAAVDACVGEKDAEERRRQHVKHLVKACRGLISKTQKKLEKCLARKSEAAGAERNRLFGELLTSNLYALKRGEKVAKVANYYEEGCPEVEIPLDVTLSPQQNAAQYFKKYAKQKRTAQLVDAQISECETTLEYLRSIGAFIEGCTTQEEIAELEKELEAAGAAGMRSARSARKEKPTAPLLYDIDGFTVAAGKNNIQNEKLTFKTANGGDIWLHAKNSHGSHVVIFAENRPVPDEVIAKAAAIAAYKSEAANSDKTEVDYTQRKNLRRHPCGKPGMVLYTVYNSVTVKPDPMSRYEIKSRG